MSEWHRSVVSYSLPSHGQRSLVGYSPPGRKESDMTERLHFHFYSAYKLNKQGDNIQSWRTPFPIWNQSIVSYLILTVWGSRNCHLGRHRFGYNWVFQGNIEPSERSWEMMSLFFILWESRKLLSQVTRGKENCNIQRNSSLKENRSFALIWKTELPWWPSG